MNNTVVSDSVAKQLRELIANAQNVVITTHMTPDGDAIGSSLALKNTLAGMGKDCKVIVPDEPPASLMFLPSAKESILIFCRHIAKAKKAIAEADLIFALDYNVITRIDRVAEWAMQSEAVKVMIDHHLYPDNFADIIISHPEKSSTCMLLFEVLCDLGFIDFITPDVASCILAGMMTDTGNFSYNCSDPTIYNIVAELLRLGAEKDKLHKHLFNTFSESSLRLNGYALSRRMSVWPTYGAALITLTREELNRYHYSRGDTEGLVNKPLAIPGIYYSAFFREEEHYIKVSFRSAGDFHVNELCSDHFDGGGHKNAAGGEFRGSMQQAIDLFVSLLPENGRYIHSDKTELENI